MKEKVGVDEQTFLDLVAKTLDAAVDERLWPDLLQQLARAAGGFGALFAGCSFSQPDSGFLKIAGLDPALSQLFIERYQDNPLSRAMRGEPLGHAVDQFALVERSSLERTEFYADVLRPQHNRALPAIGLPLGGGLDTGGVAIALDGRRDEATRNAIALLNAMAPLLRRAAIANLHLRQASDLTQGLVAALDTLPSAALLVSAEAHVVFANRHAALILAQADGLLVADGRLTALRPVDARRLHRLMQEAGQVGDGAVPRSWGSLTLARASGKRPLMILVTPLRGQPQHGTLPALASALVIATDPDEPLGDTTQAAARLHSLFGLTATEAQVAIAVARGHSGPEVAAALGIGAGTVHSHLKSVFEKTGVRRQSSLARLLTRLGVLDIP